jgi:hypothetical protein
LLDDALEIVDSPGAAISLPGAADTEDLGVELLTAHLGKFRGSKGR